MKCNIFLGIGRTVRVFHLFCLDWNSWNSGDRLSSLEVKHKNCSKFEERMKFGTNMH